MKKLILFCDGGLGNRMNVVIGGMLLAKKLNREIVINWPVNQWCGVAFNTLFDTNEYHVDDTNINDLFAIYKDDAAFAIHVNQTNLQLKYVHDVRTYSIKDLQDISNEVMIYYHNRIPEYHTEDEIINTLLSIPIQPTISDRVVSFCILNDVNENVLGIHLRRTDMELPPTTNEVITLASSNPNHRFFICSDDSDTENTLRKLDNIITNDKHAYAEKYISGNWIQLMHDAEGRKTEYNMQRSEQSVIDAFVDLLILSKTNILIRTQSTFVQLAILYNKVCK